MKQFDAHDVKIGGYEFHIFPFSAFRAANLSAELLSTLSPVVPMIGALVSATRKGGNLMDMNADVFIKAFQSITGDNVEKLMKELLVVNRNISVETGNGVETLTEGMINEYFTGQVEDMYKLAVEVIKLNFAGFFGSIVSLFGGAEG